MNDFKFFFINKKLGWGFRGSKVGMGIVEVLELVFKFYILLVKVRVRLYE